MWKSISALCITVAFAIGCTESADAPEDAHAPAYEEVVCHDARYRSMFDADERACRDYLDSCLGKLTPAQRTTWDQRVGACIQNTTAECFAEVPWC